MAEQTSSYELSNEQNKTSKSVTGEPATLLLVDDHPLLRKGLAQLVDLG